MIDKSSLQSIRIAILNSVMSDFEIEDVEEEKVMASGFIRKQVSSIFKEPIEMRDEHFDDDDDDHVNQHNQLTKTI
jgi:hypothetical protein